MFRPAITLYLGLAVVAAGLLFATPAGAAGLLIADGGLGGVLEIKDQDVHVTINNGIAVTEIDQVFVNTENRVVEALYTFPVPKAASVSNFSMWIGGKEMIGEVVEKERARRIYESYKQTKRDPGLLEQVDYKRFEMRIFSCPIVLALLARSTLSAAASSLRLPHEFHSSGVCRPGKASGPRANVIRWLPQCVFNINEHPHSHISAARRS